MSKKDSTGTAAVDEYTTPRTPEETLLYSGRQRPLVPEFPGAVGNRDVHGIHTSRDLIQTALLAVWVTCLVVGIAGLCMHYPHPRPAVIEPAPVQVEQLRVDLSETPPTVSSPANSEHAPAVAAPQTPAPTEPPPPSPALLQIVAPGPAVAFPTPVLARPSPPIGADANAAPRAVQRLTFGVGEGAQPSPIYPREAQLDGEQGRVGARFSVDQAGRVTSVKIIHPSRFPLLNEAVAGAIHRSWRFGPGRVRIFEVSIEFQLDEQ